MPADALVSQRLSGSTGHDCLNGCCGIRDIHGLGGFGGVKSLPFLRPSLATSEGVADVSIGVGVGVF